MRYALNVRFEFEAFDQRGASRRELYLRQGWFSPAATVLSSKFCITYQYLLHIMCGYQCDKAVNKNDTREVI